MCDYDPSTKTAGECGEKTQAGPTPPPSGPAAPLQGGVLEQLEQGNFAPGFAPGFLQRQEQIPPADRGAAELPLPPATEETQLAAEPPVPVCQEGLEFNEDLGFCVPEDCPEGQVLDEESGICVLEEPEAAEEPQEQPEPEEIEQQEQIDDSEDNGNN